MPTSQNVSPLSTRVSEYYAPAVNPFLGASEEQVEGKEARPPSRANEAPEWHNPEARHNGESGWIHPIPGAGASEKVALPPFAGETDRGGEPVIQKARRICSLKIWIAITAIVAALLIALGVGLGVGLSQAFRRNQSSSSSLTSSTHSTQTPSSSLATMTSVIPSRTTTTGIVFNNDHLATVGLASTPNGHATGSITVTSMGSSASAGTVQTVPVFHSSAFYPASFASTITYTAATAGATAGLGVVDCPQANNAQYIAAGGAVFEKLCYADIADSPNLAAVTVASLDQCIDACVESLSGDPALNEGHCRSVSYSANLTLAVAMQGANCWFKSTTGYPSAGDWQQSTATFIGWLVEE